MKSTRQAVAALLASLFLCSPAQAQFTVCNQTLDMANIAIAEASSGTLQSQGWWVVAPNRCADIVAEDIASQYFYIHAVDVKGRQLLPGETTMCVKPAKFAGGPTADCWRAGYAEARFHEIDTRDATSWTVFLREPAGGGADANRSR